MKTSRPPSSSTGAFSFLHLEHLPLREHQHEGENGTENVGRRAGREHAEQRVIAELREQHRHKEHHRDQEDDLTRETRSNGDPRFVDALEEVGVDDGERYERRHHRDERQRLLRDVEQHGVARERHRDETRHGAAQDRRQHPQHHADLHRQPVNAFQPLRMAGAVVVSGDGLHPLAYADDNQNHEVHETVGDAVRPDSEVAAEPDELAVENRHDTSRRHVHQERTHAYHEDVLEDITARLEAVTPEPDKRVFLQEMHRRQQSGERHRDRRRPRRARDAHLEPEDEQRVEDYVQYRAAAENEHRLGGVTARAYQRGEVERHRQQEHSRQHDDHVFVRVRHGVGRGAEENQYLIHEKIAEQHHEAAQYRGEDDAVAKDVLRPVDVFLAKYNRHPRACADPDKRAESVHDVHHRHRDGETRDCQSTDTLSDENPVTNVINRRDDLTHHRRYRICKQKRTNAFGLQFFSFVYLHFPKSK